MIEFTGLPEYKLPIPKPHRNNYPPGLVTMGVKPDMKVLLEEVWVHIATMVAKESFSTLLSMKQACRFFRPVGESDEVYKNARLVKLHHFAYLPIVNKSERRLIKRCLKSGNSEATFLKGHHEYFSLGKGKLV
ncbi:hypothetical protein PIB30_086163 [Stylosanthes scabra]|uniref:Uncharacterized protein n=1 Tax=Stylosanthes scabra TaxID=79078 RepID=A0ABU6ZRN5_9FABA|nr:hypothetical protein [Stylosanthes scabra]